MKLFVVLLPVCFLFLNPISANANGPSFWGIYKHLSDEDPFSMCVEDFNGDGIDDYAVAKLDGFGVVLSGDGGAFGPETLYGNGYFVVYVCSGDFDEDGDADLAANVIGPTDPFPPPTKLPDYLVVYLNNGNGTFTGMAGPTLGQYDSPSSACAPDLDGDGDADLVVTLADANSVRTFISAGDGTFSAGSTRTVGTTPGSVWPADFNLDGDPDVAVSNFNSANVSVLLGAGDGTLAPAVNLAAGVNPSSVCAEDFNEDGNPDLVVANQSSDNISIFLGDGNGGFGTGNNFAVNGPAALCPADLDDDGYEDLAVASTNSFSICTMLGNGNGTFDPVACVGGGDRPDWVAAGDLDGDGDVDLATPNGSFSQSVSIYLNTGDGTFPVQPEYPAGDGPWKVVTADFDGDGDLDMAGTNRYDDNLSIYLNIGNGSFAPRVNYDAGDEPLSLCFGDFDADGDLDLAVGNDTLANNGTVSVLLNQGDGTFAARVPYGVLIGAISVCAAHLDGDNVDDIAVANSRSDKVSVLISNGDGTFAAAVHYSAGAWPFALVPADFDGDGDIDLAAANNDPRAFPYGEDGMTILKNANGTFLATIYHGPSAPPFDMCGDDFDDDGDVDLAFSTIISGVFILSNNGMATYFDPVQYTGLHNHTYMAPADLDGDSDLDLAVANWQYDEVLMLVNDGAGLFGTVKYGMNTGGANTGPRGISPGDIDGDGDVDLVTANFDADEIGVLRNQQIVPTAVTPAKVATHGQLYQNVPNPFNPTTTIRYDIAAPGLVTLTIYNVMGQRVRTLVNEVQTPRAGGFAVSWNGRSETGHSVASGVYFYKLTAGSYSQVRKMVLLK